MTHRAGLAKLAAGSLLLAAVSECVADDWWSSRPIERPEVPTFDTPWGRTPIDAFVLRQLEENGLEAAPEADRRTLIRRLTYDLTGLPPTPEEVDAFASDPDPAAYEKLVDRLLESPHYGERWAQHWLDVVKYADTCGYDKDKLRANAWPYRDYVIRSFNEDKPYARFVQEQVAGDVLFPGEPDGILGLGFLAAGPWDFIGHVEVPESKIDGKVARNLDRNDMVSNTLNTFGSVNVQCARCHDHKADPITMEHYYGLQAVFAAVDRAERPYDLDPEVVRRRRQLEAELKTLEENTRDPQLGYHSQITIDPDTEKWVEVDLGKAVAVARVVLRPCHDDFAGIGAGFGFPVRFKVEIGNDAGDWITIGDQTDADVPNPGLVPFEIDDVAGETRRVRVTATRLVERKGDYIFALAELEVLDKDGVNVARGASVTSLDSIEAPVRWGKENLTDGRWPRPVDADRIEPIKAELASMPQGRMVYAAATHFEPEGGFRPTEGKLRTIHVLHRGDVQQPRDEVAPGALPMHGLAEWQFDPTLDDAGRRAALARWLTDVDHPLVWRSIVNRVWQHHFGRAIVTTPNDFGRMGAEPTHPELLDWLACEFRDGGQSLKRLHRLIVTSSVYRQSSRGHEAGAAVDGSNRFLWRMNRRRLDAEEIRDSILTVSGVMDTTMGGPGFHLFELERTEHSPHFEYHKFDPTDPASHRRSIYRFIVRSQPDPWMTTLDCADSSQSTPQRNESLTSLQALALLNNRFNLVMAERLAGRLEGESPELRVQVDRAMSLVTQRAPTDAERDDLVAYAQTHGLPNLCRMLFNLSEFVYVD